MASFEVLILESNPKRAKHFLNEIAKLDGCIKTNSYKGELHNLILWGIGGPVQQDAYKKHRAKNGNVIMLDIGYFGRNYGTEDSFARFSINDYHPQNLLKFAPKDSTRFDFHKIELKEWFNPNGHILLCGLGAKSRVMFGLKGKDWEVARRLEINSKYPNSKIIYRPKPKTNEILLGCLDGRNGDIKDYMKDCKLVVTKHSNVAVDACIYGIPVQCEDGAAMAIYSDNKQPNIDERIDFLNRLSWFNWQASEAKQFIEFVKTILGKL